MEIRKERLCSLPNCYAVAHMDLDGRPTYLLATDDAGPCYAVDAATGARQTVWDGPGGTMSLVPIPGRNAFLATRRFFPGFRAEDCEVVRCDYQDGRWHVRPWLRLPYLHRFDLLERNGRRYLLCCTLAAHKSSPDDWKSPGGLWGAELDAGFGPPGHLTQLAGGMRRNHGYCRVDAATTLTTCDQGIFRVSVPEHPGGAWDVERILDVPVSDAALCDVDGDGKVELAAIQPFHGTDFVLYREDSGRWLECWRYPREMGFVHAVWGGTLRGAPVFLGGCREKNKELFLVRWGAGGYQTECLETGMGPSNVAVRHGDDRDLILTANREAGEGALFSVYGGGEEHP